MYTMVIDSLVNTVFLRITVRYIAMSAGPIIIDKKKPISRADRPMMNAHIVTKI